MFVTFSRLTLEKSDNDLSLSLFLRLLLSSAILLLR